MSHHPPRPFLVLVFIALSLGAGSAEAEKIRVACVGDSITFGAGINDRDHASYPAVLQRLLGPTCEVKNFGHSGATLLRQGDTPYWTLGELAQADKFLPQVVVIMLGTNDSKPQNWAKKANFAKDAGDLVDHFAGLSSKPKVYVCLPPPAFSGNFAIRGTVIKQEILPVLVQTVKDKQVTGIDVFSALSTHRDVFPDGIHPNEAGDEILAKAVAAELMKNLKN